jgi:hypothetical protein
MACNTVNLLCDTSAGLVCNTTSASGCSCPTTLYAYVCDCPITKYYDGTKCVFRGTYGDYCTQTFMCTANVGLICNTTSNLCKCDSAHKYWDTSVSYCRKKIFKLYLIDFILPINFYKGTYATYSASCTSILCDPLYELICSTGTGNDCQCPTLNGGSTCDCPSTKYWDSSASICKVRVTVNSVCSFSYQCLYSTGLTCSGGRCLCTATNNYWVGTFCRKLFN